MKTLDEGLVIDLKLEPLNDLVRVLKQWHHLLHRCDNS